MCLKKRRVFGAGPVVQQPSVQGEVWLYAFSSGVLGVCVCVCVCVCACVCVCVCVLACVCACMYVCGFVLWFGCVLACLMLACVRRLCCVRCISCIYCVQGEVCCVLFPVLMLLHFYSYFGECFLLLLFTRFSSFIWFTPVVCVCVCLSGVFGPLCGVSSCFVWVLKRRFPLSTHCGLPGCFLLICDLVRVFVCVRVCVCVCLCSWCDVMLCTGRRGASLSRASIGNGFQVRGAAALC
jgi:hypothetical protein